MLYLASPYRHPNPQVRQRRYEDACDAVLTFLEAGTPVYSPIAAHHPLALRAAEKGKPLPDTWDTWRKIDIDILRHAEALYVLMLEGWEDSEGVNAEIGVARAIGIPVGFTGTAT